MTASLRAARLILACGLLASTNVLAATHFIVTVDNASGIARGSETIVIPYSEVKARLPDVLFDQILVRDKKGRAIPSQVTSFVHSHKGPQQYDDLIFQHDFVAGEKSARFTVEASAKAIAPYPNKVYLRHVPERYDDFAWENDRVAHRIYGPGLELSSAGKDQMTSSGIDIWTKKVRYPIVDHWYRKGHDGLHTDTGEGLDMYEVGMNRGAGGTGIWNGEKLATSKNWRTWKILANGPIRGIFELQYDAWDAGNDVMVTETKRFTVDAGHNFDAVESTFRFAITPPSANNTLTAAIGLSLHTTIATVTPTRNESTRAITVWEEYRNTEDGKLGTAVVLAPNASFAGFAELAANPAVPRLVRPDLLVLASVSSDQTLRYYIGGGWDKSGEFATQADWDRYVMAFAKRIATPVSITLSAAVK